MPTFEEARTTILDNISPLGVERVDLLSAVGRTIAEDIIAPWDMPFCDNSAMDGYALKTTDCQPGIKRAVIGYIKAGDSICPVVETGSAVKIMTGAPIPAGCDAVVPVEETEESDGFVVLNNPVKKSQHIRFQGEDIRTGDTAVSSGTVLRPPEIGLLASLGCATVPIYRRPRVAIISTGDELVELGGVPDSGKIINSNSYSLAAALREIGAEPVMLGIALDTRESHQVKMNEGLKADALITSAGVSAGDHDLVRSVLAELGVHQLFWKVDIKPGGPLAFGMKGNTPVFSLPGNPVSTMITFEEFVRPALLKMMGRRSVIRRTFPAIMAEEVTKKPGKVNFLRVRITPENGGYTAHLSGEQQTSYVKTMVNADGIVILPKECCGIPAGTVVQVQLLRPELQMMEASDAV